MNRSDGARFGLSEVNTTAAADARTIRRLALGGLLQLIRTRDGKNVNTAAAGARLAPMTWRRVEDGLSVRELSLIHVDLWLGVDPGTVKRALQSNAAMTALVGKFAEAPGIDDTPETFLARFAAQTRTDSPRQQRVLPSDLALPTPRSGNGDAGSLSALELANRLVEQLARGEQTDRTRALIAAVSRAMPELIERQMADADRAFLRAASAMADDQDALEPAAVG